VRRGLAAEAAPWRLDGFQLGFGTRWPALQLCDLLSNASHTSYKRCDEATALRLRRAFGDYDFALHFVQIAGRVRELLDMDALGLVVRNLAEALCDSGAPKRLRESTAPLFTETVTRLAPARARYLAGGADRR
jgi:hypothetical protein